LFAEQRDAQGKVLSRAGPLASQSEVEVTVMTQVQADRRTGWIRIGQGFGVLAQDFSNTTTGEPPRQAHESSRERWDINGDGQVDYVTVVCMDGRYDPFMGWIGTTWADLLSLRHTQVLSGDGLPAGALITLEPSAPRSWSTSGVRLSRSSNQPWDPGQGGDPSQGSTQYTGILGLRLETASGVHLAWMSPLDKSFGFEPRPRTPLYAGLVPESVGAFLNEGRCTVSWNGSLTNFVLESTPSLEPSDWRAVSVPTPGRAVLRLDAGARFFRLNRRVPGG
jgi:hypothetical protein